MSAALDWSRTPVPPTSGAELARRAARNEPFTARERLALAELAAALDRLSERDVTTLESLLTLVTHPDHVQTLSKTLRVLRLLVPHTPA